MTSILLIEPFDGASHHVLLEAMQEAFDGTHAASLRIHAFPGKKWQWKTRVAALTLAETIPRVEPGEVTHLVVTSMFNLTEFLGLRPDFARHEVRKIVYMHENQLSYPVRRESVKEERDYYFGHSQICSLLSADLVLWNSHWNLNSFLAATQSFFAKIPLPSSERPHHESINARIAAKSRVLYLPVRIPSSFFLLSCSSSSSSSGDKRARRTQLLSSKSPDETPAPLRIAFPHRFEHDKDPEMFIRVLGRLASREHTPLERDFRVRVFNGGSSYEGKDEENAQRLRETIGSERLEAFGRLERREDYLESLCECDVAVSTAAHEFYGIAMIECALLGVEVLVPNRLCYPEIFSSECLYDGSEEDLFRKLCARLKAATGDVSKPGVKKEIYEMCKSWSDVADDENGNVKETFRNAFLM